MLSLRGSECRGCKSSPLFDHSGPKVRYRERGDHHCVVDGGGRMMYSQNAFDAGSGTARLLFDLVEDKCQQDSAKLRMR